MTYGVHCCWTYVVCDFTIWRHIQVCTLRFWRSFFDTTCIFRDAGEAVEQGSSEKVGGQWKLIKNKNIITNYICFCSPAILPSKIITEILENHSEFLGARIAAKNMFQVDLDKLWITYDAVMKRHIRTRCPLLKGQRCNAPAMPLFFGVPVHIILHALSVLVVALCVTAMNINYQRSPNTEQFITAKISGNALKQGSGNRGPSVQRQPS